MRNCLIIVPHPDDEINIAGGLFDHLLKKNYNIFVAFLTYGDYYRALAPKRAREALKAQKILGYQHILYLGWGDEYEGLHIYDANNYYCCKSHAGNTETYNIDNIETFHYIKYGRQARYTKDNLKNDIKDLILEITPALIICSDTDNHPDHRALSLLFDEVVGELLKKTDYHPTILKRFAYLGSYKGIDDFFCNPIRETLPSYFNLIEPSLSYPYCWDDRLKIQVSKKNADYIFWKSPIYKALLCHSSQYAVRRFSRIVNRDIIFWERRTDSLSYKANLEVSSGDGRYINDFKIVDTDDIRSLSPTIIPSINKAWSPNVGDSCPYINFKFDSYKSISCIVIYKNPDTQIGRIHLLFDNGFVYNCDKCKMSVIKVIFPKQHNVRKIKISFKECRNLSINEIEIYENYESTLTKLLKRDYNTVSKDENKTGCYILLELLYNSIVVFYSIIIFEKRLLKYIKKLIWK